jgi:hypothetical protein
MFIRDGTYPVRMSQSPTARLPASRTDPTAAAGPAARSDVTVERVIIVGV